MRRALLLPLALLLLAEPVPSPALAASAPGAVLALGPAQPDSDSTLSLAPWPLPPRRAPTSPPTVSQANATEPRALTTAEALESFGLPARTSLVLGGSLVTVAAARLDPDPWPDLAVTDAASPYSLVLLRNDGSGSFEAPVRIPLSHQPYAVEAADLDQDGDTDLVVSLLQTNGSDGSVVVFLNDGTGAFTEGGRYGVGCDPLALTLADWSGDGRCDLIAVNYGSPYFSVLRGRGDGSFDPPFSVPASSWAISAAVRDVDRDGRAEVAISYDRCNSLSLFRAESPAGPTYVGEIGIRWGAEVAALGDLDGDPWPDLAVATSQSAVTVVPNSAGRFSSWTDLPGLGLSTDLELADLDADGRDEAVAISNSNDAATVVRRGEDGAWRADHYGTSPAPAWLAVADFDGDGHRDVVSAEYYGGTLDILWGEGDGRLRSSREFSTGSMPCGVSAADVDGDGRLDLIVPTPRVDRVCVLPGLGERGFSTLVQYEVGYAPVFATAGDLTGDGRPEIVAANQESGGITVLTNDGAGRFLARTDIATGSQPFCVAIGDLDGDGRNDVAVANYKSNTLSLLRNVGGGALVLWQTLYTGVGPTGVTFGDLDSDLDLDIVVTCYDGNLVELLWNDGSGGFPRGSVLSADSGPWRATVVPSPTGGHSDVLVVNRKTSSLSRYSWEASLGAYVLQDIYNVGANPSSVVGADLNDDGRPDFVVSLFNQAALAILASDAHGGLSPAVLVPAGLWPEALLAGDFTGDGVTDLVVVNQHGRTISLFDRRAASPGAGVPDLQRGRVTSVCPNPASGSVGIVFALERAGPARVSILDLSGRRVRSLASGAFPAGPHTVVWDGRDDGARPVPAGVYLCMIETAGRRQVARLAWLR